MIEGEFRVVIIVLLPAAVGKWGLQRGTLQQSVQGPVGPKASFLDAY